MMKKAAIAFVLFSVVSCGGGSSSTPSTPTTPTAPSQPANIAGTYTLVLEASDICTGLPSRVRQRVYTATLTQTAAQVAINLTRASCTGPECSLGDMPGGNLSSGTLSGNSVSFVFAFLENITGAGFTNSEIISVYGTSAEVPVATLAGQWNGSINYLATGRDCNATNHGFSFRRR